MWPPLWHIAPGTARAYRRTLPRGGMGRGSTEPKELRSQSNIGQVSRFTDAILGLRTH
jgi:hypothetical protein